MSTTPTILKQSRNTKPSGALQPLIDEVRYFTLSSVIRDNHIQEVLGDIDLMKRCADELGLGFHEAAQRLHNAIHILPKRVENLPWREVFHLRGWHHFEFPMVHTLSDLTARGFAQISRGMCPVHLNFPSLVTVSADALSDLSLMAYRISLGVENFSAEFARAIQQRSDAEVLVHLDIRNLKPGGAAARSLFEARPWRLFIENCPDLASINAIVESEHQVGSLVQFSCPDLTQVSQVSRAISPFQGSLQLMGLEALNGELGSVLAGFRAQSLLVAAATVDKAGAQFLSFFPGKHLVLASVRVEEGSLWHLLDFDGPLLVFGVQTISDEDVRKMTQRRSPISLPDVESLTDWQAQQLREAAVPVEFGAVTRMSPEMREEMNRNGYGSLRFGYRGPSIVPVWRDCE